MLVLTRKEGESIEIGGGVVISVVKVNGNRVRLGIEAPPDVPVVRSELNQKPKQKPAEASNRTDIAATTHAE